MPILGLSNPFCLSRGNSSKGYVSALVYISAPSTNAVEAEKPREKKWELQPAALEPNQICLLFLLLLSSQKMQHQWSIEGPTYSSSAGWRQPRIPRTVEPMKDLPAKPQMVC
jgi:hypothetical protein